MATHKKILIFSCLLGILSSLYATLLTVEVQSFGLGVETLCSINNLFDCNSVAASKSAILFGVPVAWWGFLYYLWLGTYIVRGIFYPDRFSLKVNTALTITILAMIFSVYKAYELVFILKVFCIVCVTMYIANLSILLALIKIRRLSLKQNSIPVNRTSFTFSIHGFLTHFYKSDRVGFVSMIAIFFTGYLLFAVAWEGSNQTAFKMKDPVKKHFLQAKRNIEIVPGAPFLGSLDASVTMVEFIDFQCPACKNLSIKLHELLLEFNGEIGLYVIHFPLDRSINPYVSINRHLYAGLAARASIYAQNKGDFWSFHDELFLIQRNLNPQTILTLVKKRGWNVEDFKSSVNSEAIVEKVREHIEYARRANIDATPTLFINGRRLRGWSNSTVLKEIIIEEIRREKSMLQLL